MVPESVLMFSFASSISARRTRKLPISLQGLLLDSFSLSAIVHSILIYPRMSVLDPRFISSAFLVDKSSIDEFSLQVGKLTDKYDHLKVQYSGPWPAYNFVDIHILGGKRRGFR